VPEMKYFYKTPVVVDLIINLNRTVYQLAHGRSAMDDTASTRKTTKQLHMIEYSTSKASSGVGVIICNNADDLGQVP
jgi:hypothetical protein